MEIHKRFHKANYYKLAQNLNVTVGGAGSLGSWVSLFLSRKGCKVDIWDFDKVEAHNLGGQLYRKTDVNIPKTTALGTICADFGGTPLFKNSIKYEEDSTTYSVCMACFDDIEARKDMFTNWLKVCEFWKENDMNTPTLFVDARLSHDNFEIYAVPYESVEAIEAYKKTLFPKEEAADLPCGLKYSTEYAAMAAAQMVAMLNNYLSNQKLKANVYQLGFYEYIGSFNKLKKINGIT